MLKAGGEITMGVLTEIFEGIWETEETPGDWKMGLIVKLPKKGDLSLCKNWRGITLLSITSNVFSRVIFDRISEALDPLLRKEQAGFRKGKSCGDHIFTIQRKSDELARNAEKIGLQININKTKMLRNNSQTADPITIGGKVIEEVTEFTYLGAKVSTDGNSESEI
ncbi:hypothetical protein LSAT2_019819, partial [Lamellibrachia satsuma]